jgi:hypothetical protein
MSRFDDLIATADNAVLVEFADTYRWSRGATTIGTVDGILDLEMEFYGPESDVPYLGKAFSARSADIGGHQHGDTLQMLDAAGSPVGPIYRLQQTITDDGALKTIEITA